MLSAVVILLSLLVRSCSAQVFSFHLFVCDFAVSCGIMILTPQFIEVEGFSAKLLYVAAATDIALMLASAFSDGKATLVGLAYSAVILLPLTLASTLAAVRKMTDKEYLSSHISGWESALGQFRWAIAILYMFIVAVQLQCRDGGVLAVALNVISLLVLVLLYLFLLLRGITSSCLEPRYTGELEERGTMPSQFFNYKKADSVDIGYRRMYKRLCDAMERRKLYLDPSLSLEKLAAELYTNRGYLSKMINSCTGMNYNLLVNQYRVEYAMSLIRDNPKRKVGELPELCGFKTAVTFITAFKLSTGMTPSEWQRDYCGSLASEPSSPKAPQPPSNSGE